jgi:hypothetical protein
MTEVELSLWERYGQHEKKAQTELILRYLPLVDLWAKRIAKSAGARWEELRHDGVIGLVKAIARFDPCQGVPFSAFAKHYISEAIFNSPRLSRDMDRPEEIAFADNGIKVPHGQSTRPGSPQALLKALEAFTGDEEALREHFEEIAKERRKQREEAARQDPG